MTKRWMRGAPAGADNRDDLTDGSADALARFAAASLAEPNDGPDLRSDESVPEGHAAA